MTDPRQTGSPKSRARDKTAQMRLERAEAAKRQERNQRIFKIVGVLVAVGLVAAIVWAVLDSAGGGDTKPRSSGNDAPANIIDEAAVPVGEEDAPVTVDLYYDYMCPACGAFEQVNGSDLSELIDDGTAKVNLRVLNFLDGQSGGTQFSTRAGNAMATVADGSPELVWDFHHALFLNQPTEGGRGLSDQDLVDIADEVGVPSEVSARFADGTYDNWVAKSNDLAGEDGVSSTPTVKINGEEFTGNWSEAGAVRAAIEAAAE